TDVAFITAKKYLLELKEHNIDSLVLGCTHYPALRYTINKVLGDKVTMVNPAYEAAKAGKIMLKEKNLLSNRLDGGKCDYYVSDDPEKFKRIGGNILRKEIASVQKVNIENL
ncbi:glutamate racemase, partial [Schnuerera sp.]|uniref:glutamate racemase n=1 Tax=Schnuerera sp. TaxID=2794844 RepID=UPI002CD79EE4|nr:glutamate racemase [Schnuerera sp.]